MAVKERIKKVGRKIKAKLNWLLYWLKSLLYRQKGKGTRITEPQPIKIEDLVPDYETYCHESRAKTVHRFKEKTTFYLDGILFRIHKLSMKGMEIRPIRGAPRHRPIEGKNPLSLPMPGKRCPLCGEKVGENKR